MKKYLFFATALAALASCTSNDFVGEDTSSTTNQSEQAAIAFGTGVNSITRADHVGADAAGLLNKKFIVGGFKGDGSDMTQVFDNYIVEWTSNTAGKTTSNTSDWEYVGVTAAAPSAITGVQTIKYWDYSTSQYDFAAFSTGDIPTENVKTSGTASSGEVVISGISKANTYAGPTYTIAGAAADLAKCYISDLVTVYKADYQKEVQLTFRNLATKVRVALYETIPGYSVKEVKFYTDNTTTIAAGTSETKATLFAPNTGDADKFFNAGTATVTFPTIGSTNKDKSDYNKAHVTFSPSGSGTSETKEFGTLNYTGKESREADLTQYLARNSSTPTFAGTAANNYYLTVLPNETGTVLELRIDYTLLSIDGSGEEIKIHGAKAYVPAIYAAWKSNYAYTYIFKITDNTNGWTSTVETDPASLYPITFDAIVVDAEQNTQSTITTVATPSITTYQKGHDYSAQETYKAGDIYVQVMTGTTLESDLASKGFLYTLSDADATEAEVMDAISIQEAAIANPPATITGRNGLVLTNAETSVDVTGITTIPGADGNNITVTEGTAAKITATANTYAYIYDTDTYNGIYLATEPADWTTAYYSDAECKNLASGVFEAGTFYQPSSVIRSYVELASKPSDWKADTTNPYYSDEACTTQITSEYANPAGASYTTKPADWPRNYYNNATFTEAAETFTAGTTYYRKLACYRKYTVNNKIYGVKVIKVVSGS